MPVISVRVTMAVAIATLLLTCWAVCAVQGRIVDLTHVHDENCMYWPMNRKFEMETSFSRQMEDAWVTGHWFGTPEHSGTHLDAPLHFVRDGEAVANIPPEQLIGPGVVINVKDQVAKNLGYSLSEQDLRAWEAKYGRIPKGAIVLMNSGWSARYPDRKSVFNSEKVEDTTTFQFPGFDPAAVQWLLSHRDINMIGTDTPSFDSTGNGGFRSHIVLLGAGKLGLENVANLDALPANGSIVFVGTLKLGRGSGAPSRVLAVLPDSPLHYTLSGSFSNRGSDHAVNPPNGSPRMEVCPLCIGLMTSLLMLVFAAQRV